MPQSALTSGFLPRFASGRLHWSASHGPPDTLLDHERLRLEGNHLSDDARDCLVAAGITTAAGVVGGIIGGAAARAIAGGIIGGGGAACAAKIVG